MLHGFLIAGYRSFGPEPVRIPDLKKVNVFIGSNNSGKSNILRFVHRLSSFSQEKGMPSFPESLDHFKRDADMEIQYGFQFSRAMSEEGGTFRRIVEGFPGWDHYLPELRDHLWVAFLAGQPVTHGSNPAIRDLAAELTSHLDPRQSDEVLSKTCGRRGGSHESRATELAQWIVKQVQCEIRVETIEAFRVITDGTHVSPHSGAGLIKRLRSLQNPVLDTYDGDTRKFQTIENFLRDILGDPSARLEIPAEKDEIYISLDGRLLPLQSLGTGIHELVILAAAVTITDNVIFCIEEPEIHLHPALQKKFLGYLLSATNNQYMITSHSNAVLDVEGVNVYHCRLEAGQTRCELATSLRQRSALLRDLGYKASDLLQANYVVWVEGPSDRILLAAWLHVADPSLIEGLHYSIMFYGGRLLAHLSYDSPEVSDFVQLARLNRNSAIVMDSDRTGPKKRLNDTKQRVRREFSDNDQHVWVTAGRTIENYVDHATFSHAVTAVHPKVGRQPKKGRYEDYTRVAGTRAIDKVAVARQVVRSATSLVELDLQHQIRRLVSCIQRANA